MKTQRTGLILANSLLIIALLIFACSCNTYKRALRKFGHLAKDSATVIVRDTLITRKDSVVLRVKTDTSTVHQIIQQGRARIIYDRTHTITTVKGECLPDTVIREIPAKCPPVATFGIAPWYKTAFIITLVLFLALILYVLFFHLFKLSMTKR